jgi:hypothetical protein
LIFKISVNVTSMVLLQPKIQSLGSLSVFMVTRMLTNDKKLGTFYNFLLNLHLTHGFA